MNRIIKDVSDFIFVSEAPRKADAMFLPGCIYPEQAEYAAKLYKEGYAKLLVPSGGISIKFPEWRGVGSKKEIYNKEYRTESEFFADVLIKNGVPESAILEEKNARYTRENAFLTKDLLDEKGIVVKTVLLVCRSFHARRALMLYQMAFPETEFVVCPVDTVNVTKENWYLTKDGIHRVFGELRRCGNQFLDDILVYLLKE